LISEAGMVMISPSNTSPSLTSDLAGTAGKNYYPGYYRTAHNDLYQGAAAAGFATEVLGVTTAAAIHDGDPYTQGLAQAFADAFEALGGTITTFTAVNKGDTDMIPVLTEIAAGSPELLFFPIFQPEGDFIVQQVHEVSGMDGVTLMAADGLMVSNFMELPESEGLYFSGPDLRYGSNGNQSLFSTVTAARYLEEYPFRWGEKPSAAFWAHSVDATTLLLEAIDAASYVDDDGTLVIDRAGVREFLSNVRDYQGFTGLLSCDEFGDCGSQKITVIGHTNSSDVDGSLANVIYEYSPAGGSQVRLLYDFSAVSEALEGYVAEQGMNGASLVVVHRDDGVIHQEFLGEFQPGRISLIASTSKLISAGVLMRLHEDGLLDMDAPVADVVEWGSANPEITPAQLVSNSSGLVGLMPNPFYDPYVCQFDQTTTLQACAEAIFTTTDDDADVAPPDTEFRYGGAQWQVAGAVAEAASGKSWAELVDETYVQPCGLGTLAYTSPFGQFPMDWTVYPPFDGDPASLMPSDNPMIEGGVHTTSDDYATLLLMHLRGGMCGENRVHSAEAIDVLHSDRAAEMWDGSALDPMTGIAILSQGYGYGWWTDRDTGRIWDPGAFGSNAWLDLDDGYGAYVVLEGGPINGDAQKIGLVLDGPVHEAVLAARG
jgi:CubicO group peptidase (beta-lactamase class C family)/ABC-type branched-subunit amino acid transport system substrate-binding protein